MRCVERRRRGRPRAGGMQVGRAVFTAADRGAAACVGMQVACRWGAVGMQRYAGAVSAATVGGHRLSQRLELCFAVNLYFLFHLLFAFWKIGHFLKICIFCVFGRTLFAGLHFSCILAGRRFQACLFFSFWSSSGFGCTFFAHFAGSRPPQPKNVQNKCDATFRHGGKHQKKTNSNSRTYWGW